MLKVSQYFRVHPFSFPIITDRLRARMSSEALGDKIKRMIAEYTKA